MHSSTNGLESGIMQSLVTTTNDDANSLSNDRPTLPAELVSKIITYIQHNQQYATLAKMAQTNSTFYDIVVPKLYETITITKNNITIVSYGTRSLGYHRWTSCVGEDSDDKEDLRPSLDGIKTRKDRAIEWCVRLVVDTPTKSPVDGIKYLVNLLPHHRYGKVEELVFTRRAMRNARADEDTWSLSKILPPFAPIGSRDEDVDCTPQIKRVVLHLADDFGRPPDVQTPVRMVQAAQ